MAKNIISGETKEQRKARKIKEKLAKQPIQEIIQEVHISSNESIAFVLGNGTSRTSIDPRNLKRHGKIYGCNALYRSFAPDYLIAVDTKMIKEITSAGYHLQHPVYTNPNKYSKEIYGLNLFEPNLGWSSGPSALNLASKSNYSTIYILGFDYVGIGNKNELVNNVYAGTVNYKKINERATYFGNWQRQTSIAIQKHPKVKYIRVIADTTSFVPDSLVGLQNLTHITLENFKKRFNIE